MECARHRAQQRDTAKGVGENESNGLLLIAVAEDGYTPGADFSTGSSAASRSRQQFLNLFPTQ